MKTLLLCCELQLHSMNHTVKICSLLIVLWISSHQQIAADKMFEFESKSNLKQDFAWRRPCPEPWPVRAGCSSHLFLSLQTPTTRTGLLRDEYWTAFICQQKASLSSSPSDEVPAHQTSNFQAGRRKGVPSLSTGVVLGTQDLSRQRTFSTHLQHCTLCKEPSTPGACVVAGCDLSTFWCCTYLQLGRLSGEYSQLQVAHLNGAFNYQHVHCWDHVPVSSHDALPSKHCL